jgi:hypothetical protein
MSLVNSLINQVGREIGRDLYWSAKQSFVSGSTGSLSGNARRKSQVQFSSNQELTSLVSKKKWSSRMRFAAMKQDICETIDLIDDKINPRSFDWREVYEELDNRIDELKLTCKDEEAPELEQLDKQNYVSFSISLERHKRWLAQELESDQQSVKIPSKSTIFLLSFFGLTSNKLRRGSANAVAEVFCAMIWWSLIALGLIKLRESADDKAGLGLIGIGLAFYLLILIGDFISLSDLVKGNDAKENQRNQLRKYLSSLDHSL